MVRLAVDCRFRRFTLLAVIRHSPRLPLLAALAAALALSACAPKLYTLNLSRARQTGEKFSLVSSITELSQSHSVISFPGGHSPQSDDRDIAFAAQLEGEGEVLAVFPNGGIQKLSFTLKSITATRGGKPVANLPAPGAHITAFRKDDGVAISVNDQPADPAVTDALNELILLGDEKSTPQEMFGTPTPVKVGATWAPSSPAMEEALKGDLGGKSNGASGTMQLASVQGSGDSAAATVTGNFTMQEYKPGLPSTMKLDAATITGALSWTVPVTAAKGSVTFSRELRMSITAHGNPNDTSLKLTVSGVQKRSVQMVFR